MISRVRTALHGIDRLREGKSRPEGAIAVGGTQNAGLICPGMEDEPACNDRTSRTVEWVSECLESHRR